MKDQAQGALVTRKGLSWDEAFKGLLSTGGEGLTSATSHPELREMVTLQQQP